MTINSNSFIKGSKKFYNKKLIGSIDEFQDYVNFFTKKWVQDELWFRGVSKFKYELIPSIYRKELWKYDRNSSADMHSAFIHKAMGLIKNSSTMDKWQWLQTMQHFGLPTRLLDWTEGYLVAMYFSIRNLKSIMTPCVWIINPYELNEKSTNGYTMYYSHPVTRKEEDKIIDKYIDDNNLELPQDPIALVPPYINERMSSQRSCFTIHGSKHNGFYNLYSKNKDFHLVQLRIKTSSAPKIKEQLYTMGISESTLFPDLEGLSRDLMFSFKMNLK